MDQVESLQEKLLNSTASPILALAQYIERHISESWQVMLQTKHDTLLGGQVHLGRYNP